MMQYVKFDTASTALALVIVAGVAPPVIGQTRPVDFGKQWVRNHPFTITALNQGYESLDVDQYRGAGMNALLAWWAYTAPQTAVASQEGLPWHAHIDQLQNGLTADVLDEINRVAASSGGVGWLLHDEPEQDIFPQMAEVADYLRQTYPDMLVYTNSRGSDPWAPYLDDMVETIQPDLLMYDNYPFRDDGKTRDSFFEDMMAHRAKGLEEGIPYWTFIQAFRDDRRRLPSESDLRMHIFTHLTAGYTGVAYFAYHFLDTGHDGGLETAMLDPDDEPTAVYDSAADLAPDVLNLGQSLRFLTSVGVRFVPGRYFGGKFENLTPPGMTDWSSGAGGDTRIHNVDVDHSMPDSFDIEKNGLIGFFTDDDGQQYFMLTNLWHERDTSAADAQLSFVVDFDESVDELLMFDRLTGREVLVPLDNHRLQVTLPGGTGNLYKYPTGPFAPLSIGDMNIDGMVDFDDIVGLVLGLNDADDYEALYAVPASIHGDTDGDDDLDFDDIEGFVDLLASDFQRHVVPEPGGLPLAVLAAWLICCLRHRRSRM